MSNKSEYIHEEANETDELSNETNEFEQSQSGYTSDSITKLPKKFIYHEIGASSSCKLTNPFYNSKSTVKTQKDANYCVLWCLLAHNTKVDMHRGNESHYKKAINRNWSKWSAISNESKNHTNIFNNWIF